jgi:hypothetical protein
MVDVGVEMAVQMTARMFGLPRATATEIVAVALPVIASMAEHNPALRWRLYVASLARPPERIEDLFARMLDSPFVRQAVMDDYKATDGQARDVIAAAPCRNPVTGDHQPRWRKLCLSPAPARFARVKCVM